MNRSDKLKKSIVNLEHALSFKKESKDPFYFGGISKAFEVCLEYAWKYFKLKAQEESLEAYSPRESIKIAGQLGIIDDVELWLGYLNDRNLAVHDYIGIDDPEYMGTIESFLSAVKKIDL